MGGSRSYSRSSFSNFRCRLTKKYSRPRIWRSTNQYVTAFLGTSSFGDYGLKGQRNSSLCVAIDVCWNRYLFICLTPILIDYKSTPFTPLVSKASRRPLPKNTKERTNKQMAIPGKMAK